MSSPESRNGWLFDRAGLVSPLYVGPGYRPSSRASTSSLHSDGMPEDATRSKSAHDITATPVGGAVASAPRTDVSRLNWSDSASHSMAGFVHQPLPVRPPIVPVFQQPVSFPSMGVHQASHTSGESTAHLSRAGRLTKYLISEHRLAVPDTTRNVHGNGPTLPVLRSSASVDFATRASDQRRAAELQAAAARRENDVHAQVQLQEHIRQVEEASRRRAAQLEAHHRTVAPGGQTGDAARLEAARRTAAYKPGRLQRLKGAFSSRPNPSISSGSAQGPTSQGRLSNPHQPVGRSPREKNVLKRIFGRKGQSSE